MNGADHFRVAERYRERASEAQNAAYDGATSDGWEKAAYFNAAAQVHATLALAAATIEAADHDPDGWRLIGRPVPAQHGDPAYPGTPWGRAFFGDRHLDEGGDQA